MGSADPVSTSRFVWSTHSTDQNDELTSVPVSGCSIWAVELLRREILILHPETHVNAVLIDFFLYDLAKEREANGEFQLVGCEDAVQRIRLIMKHDVAGTPHHRTRSIWY